MTADVLLPLAFADLEPFMAAWDVDDADARALIRAQSSLADLAALYDAVLPRLDAALAYLGAFEVGAFPAAEQRLFRLLLALCEASMVVELFGQPDLPNPGGRIAFTVTRPLPPI